MRSSDWVARYGGEEFVIVLPETNVANAATAAEHLRARDQSARRSSRQARVFPSTASFGVAGWKAAVPQGSALDALMAKCDAGVYASKAAGRNGCRRRRWAESGLLATGLWPESADGPSALGSGQSQQRSEPYVCNRSVF